MAECNGPLIGRVSLWGEGATAGRHLGGATTGRDLGGATTGRGFMGWVAILAGMAVLLSAASAFGHEVYVSARVDGTTLRGEAYYHGKVPAKNMQVTAFDPAGEELGKTKTDGQGKFTLEARFRCDHRLLLDTGDGHGAEFTVTAAELPGSLPLRGNGKDTSPQDGDVAGLRAEVSRLRDELRDYEQRIRLSDIAGGVGYILGLAGVAFYFLGVRRKESKV